MQTNNLETILEHTKDKIIKYNNVRPENRKVNQVEMLEFKAFVSLFYARDFFSWYFENYEIL